MAVYAIAHDANGGQYINTEDGERVAPKEYAVIDEPALGEFTIYNDKGRLLRCRWENCPHLFGASWERVERDEQAP